MSRNDAEMIKAILPALIIVLVASLAFILDRRLSAIQKRKWMPRLTLVAATLFVVFISVAMLSARGWRGGWNTLAIFASAIALFTFVIIKQTKYCDKCNATHYNQGLWAPMKFCSRCGAPLDVLKPKTDDDLLSLRLHRDGQRPLYSTRRPHACPQTQ